jgi:hypothetical protein
MRKARLFFGILLLCPTLLGGCHYDELVYTCHSDDNCVVQGVQGVCIAAGAGASYCAFRDGKCASGLRWDTTAPSAIDGNCVAFPDGGAGDLR